MVRSLKVATISLLALTLLVGCDDNEPSTSDIMNQENAQLAKLLGPCKGFSISDLQKINGFPQPDGSYIDQIKYTLNYHPPDGVTNAFNTYYPQIQTLQSEFQAQDSHLNQLINQMEIMKQGCNSDDTPSQSCQEKVVAFAKANEGYEIQRNSTNHELHKITDEFDSQLNSSFGSGCSLDDIEGVLQLLITQNGNEKVVDTSYQVVETETVHFIKSDNGWVIEN
jgi:hypothetical protein